MLSVARIASSRTLASRLVVASTSSFPGCNLPLQRRNLSSKDVFSSQAPTGFSIPDVPLPRPPTKSVEELFESGESQMLEELGLWSWWKPSSYFRWALESIHVHLDVPWWTTIICATVVLRLALIGVPIMSQKLVAKQSAHRKELDAFRLRIEDARKEGNMLEAQQVLLEQRDFLKSKDIKLGRQFVVMVANGSVFLTQFFALKKMIEVKYPGLSTGGTAWFPDLTVSDPYFALPIISAATLALVTRVGIETGQTADQMGPAMRIGMQYVMPGAVLIFSSQFASGLCVYWCASNFVSLAFAGAFRTKAIRKLFNSPFQIPDLIKPTDVKKHSISDSWRNYKAKQNAPPTLNTLRLEDAKRFKKAGQGKPQV
ncbi:unnamed protein product, partial [Mesorhabditis spiculigera]